MRWWTGGISLLEILGLSGAREFECIDSNDLWNVQTVVTCEMYRQQCLLSNVSNFIKIGGGDSYSEELPKLILYLYIANLCKI